MTLQTNKLNRTKRFSKVEKFYFIEKAEYHIYQTKST